jgi:divalent metal cation (Fe/Co/Zn/Cd) transporter
VYAALAGDLAIATVKLLAARLPAARQCSARPVNSLVDTINELLLPCGFKQADGRPDVSHPFGYRRELDFWSIFLLLVFALGAGLSLYEGIGRVTAA